MIETLYKLLVCHFIGDYVLQTDFLAGSKGSNLWHMIAHCFLYSLPFFLLFGFGWRIAVLIGTHIVIDLLKARYKKISYVEDQIYHLWAMLVYFV